MSAPSAATRRFFLSSLLPAACTATPARARSGGALNVALRSDLKTFLPLAAIDDPTRNVLSLCHSGLIRTNGVSQKVEGVLAERWKVSGQGRRISVRLREGLRFSDGRPITSADVAFTLQAHLDPRSASPQRDLLIIGGKPVEARPAGPLDIDLLLAAPSALAERLLDELAILPRHALEDRLRAGTLATAWGLASRPESLIASGPFRVSEYRPGERVTLERNPRYRKSGPSGERLPHLDRVTFFFTSGEDAQLARLIAGECDLVANLGAGNTALLDRYSQQRQLELVDLGASLDAVFLLFNLSPERVRLNPALQDASLRAAVSASLDRQAIAKLVYRGRAVPMASHVSPGRRYWCNASLAVASPSPDRIRDRLKKAGHRFQSNGALLGADGNPVRFTLTVNSSNPAYGQIASIVAADLQRIGVSVQTAPLEFRSFVDRVMHKRDFDLAVMPLRSGNADPMADMNILLSGGPMHLWNPGQTQPATNWEAEIDRLMQLQAATPDLRARKRAFDRVQEIMAEQNPLVPLVSPHTLLAVRRGLGNFRPSVLPNAALWNAEEIYWAVPPR